MGSRHRNGGGEADGSVGARVLTDVAGQRVLEESHVAPWGSAPSHVQGPLGRLDLGVPQDWEQQDRGCISENSWHRALTPLCLQVIGILWNELFSHKDCFFLKRDKILANYQSNTATMRPQLFMPTVRI